MKNKLLSLVLILTLIQQAFSHGWMVYPMPRGFLGANNQESASTSGPCGDIADEYSNVTIVVQQNDVLNVDWTIGGGHDGTAGQSICRFSVSTTDISQESFDATVLANFPCKSTDTSQGQVPITVDPGIYYLQFHWFAGDGGNWYSCAIINVTEGPKLQLFNSPAETRVDSVINAPEQGLGEAFSIYHSITANVKDAYQHLIVKFNHTSLSGELNVSASTIFPKTYLIGTHKLAQNYVQTINLCNIAALTPKVYVGLFADPTYVGNASFTTHFYDGELSFNGRSEFEIHAQGGDILYYRSSAYSEITSSRRLVIWGRGGKAYTAGPVKNCQSDNEIPSDPNYCVDLPLEQTKPENPQTHYYAVYFDGQYDGKVMLQKGNCASYSGVETLIVSFLSVLAAVLLI